MAYYNSGHYIENRGEYNIDYPSTPYYNNYNYALVQGSSSYSSYTSNDYYSSAYDSTPFFADYDHHSVSNSWRIGYSVSAYCEPKYIEYEPEPHYYAQTRFTVSYSVAAVDDTDFEEYDPTPYGGGYDITLTYGKPLPPSDKTCYPRSTPPSVVPPAVIPPPVVQEVLDKPAAKPQVESKPAAPKEPEQQQQPLDKQLDLHKGGEMKETYNDDRGSWSSNEYEKPVVSQIPPGYGLEAMDLCEGMFGYWPCLTRYQKKWNDHCQCNENIASECVNYSTQWKSTADYLFGNPNPYGERRDDDHGSTYYGNVMYNYQRHYQEQQSLYHQVDDTWSAYLHNGKA